MTMAEACRRFELTADTLRYYERIGLLPHVRRNASGNRDYSEEDGKWVEFIKCMRGSGISIEVLHTYITLFHQGEETFDERMQLLVDQRDQLEEKIDAMRQTLARLNRKIEHYQQVAVQKERALRKPGILWEEDEVS